MIADWIIRVTAMTALLVAVAAAILITPKKRVGIDWEHHRFMPREEQDPIVPEAPRGLVWYAEQQARRT